MKTLKHFVFAITLLVGTTLFANNDPVINYKTSTTCEKFEDLKFEVLIFWTVRVFDFRKHAYF